jgi:DNA-binding transcriptional ArsR family regulator
VAGTRIKPVTNIDDPRFVKALAHPTRIRILAMLRERRASPNELSQRLELPLGRVAYHVRTLDNLGLIRLVDTAPRRGATEHFYEAAEHPRFTDEAWARVSPVGKQRMLSAMLQQAGDYAAGSAAAGGFDRPDAVITRHSLRLDAAGWDAMVALANQFVADMDEIGAEAAERNAETDGHDTVDVGVILMLFEALPLSDRPTGRAPLSHRGSGMPDNGQ